MGSKLTPSNFWPNTGSATYALLRDLLQGDTITIIDSVMRYNLMTPNARVAELRSAGWPIMSLKVPHPELVGESLVGYHMDAHFRGWWIDNWETSRPVDYTPKAGRGKFA